MSTRDFSKCAFCGRDVYRPLWAARNITDPVSGTVIGAEPEAVGLCCISRVPMANRMQLEDPKPARVGIIGNGAIPGLARAISTVEQLMRVERPPERVHAKPQKPPKPRLDYNDLAVPTVLTGFAAGAQRKLATSDTMLTTARRLLHLTRGCRPDMHEPDEQGLSAKVAGATLDNAFGDAKQSSELRVVLVRDGEEGSLTETVTLNLASLLALARIGGATICESVPDAATPAEPDDADEKDE